MLLMEMKEGDKEGRKDREDVDVVERLIGGWGRWQCRLITMIMLPQGIFSSWFMLVPVFYNPETDHWCAPATQNWTQQEWKAYAIPYEKDGTLSQCKMRNPEMMEDSFRNISSYNTTACQNGWKFDHSLFENTMEEEFSLVCDRESLAKSVASVYNLGLLVGLLPSGQLADMMGRKKSLLLSIFLTIPVGILIAVMPGIWYVLALRFLLAVGFSGCFTHGYVLAIETVGEKSRTAIGMLVNIPWCIGYITLGLLAYLANNWRHLQLIISVPFVLGITFWWVLPESARWLLSKGRTEEAREILERAVKINKRDIPLNAIGELQQDYQKKEIERRYTVLDLLRTPRLRARTLNIYFNYMANALVYYGLSLSVPALGGNTYINFLISGAVELPAYTLTVFALMKGGRRWSLCSSMVLAGVACFVTIIIPKSKTDNDFHHWMKVCFAMMGKFCVTASFAIVYLYSTELFPTVTRGVGVTSGLIWARIGSIIAPYVDLLRHVYVPLPMIGFGSFSVVAGLLVLLLPETTNRPLPETIEDAEKFEKFREKTNKPES